MSLKQKFCVRCGIETKLFDNFCPECYFETHEVKVPKRKEIRTCSKCGAVLIERFWVISEKSKPKIFAEQVKLAIQSPEEIKIVEVDLPKIKAEGSIDVTFNLDGSIFSRKYPANLAIKKEICPICKKNSPEGSKAVIQLRTRQHFQKFKLEMYDYLKKYTKSIINIKDQKTGLDVKVLNRNLALRISRDFKQKFNMHMKETRKEYSWDRSKNRPKYKSTILLKKK